MKGNQIEINKYMGMSNNLKEVKRKTENIKIKNSLRPIPLFF
jgi:hypothetical protein